MRKPRRSTVFNEVLTLTILWVFFLCACTINSLLAQPATATAPVQLKMATFCFVYPTASAKTNALRDEMNRLQDHERRNKILAKIRQSKLEADSFTYALQRAVEQHFEFGDYSFIADTSVREYLSTLPPDDTVYFVRRSTTESRVDALILHDRHMQPLRRPVPYYARITGFSSFLDAFFGKRDYNWKDLTKVIEKWSARLEQFASRHG